MHIKAESWDISIIIIIDKVIFLSLSKPKPNLLKRVTKSNNSMFCPLCLLKIEVGVIPVKPFSPSVSSFKRQRHKKEGNSYKLHMFCFFSKKSQLIWVFPLLIYFTKRMCHWLAAPDWNEMNHQRYLLPRVELCVTVPYSATAENIACLPFCRILLNLKPQKLFHSLKPAFCILRQWYFPSCVSVYGYFSQTVHLYLPFIVMITHTCDH